tara:strand:+ start:1302 stop:2039 length:738 start_codon:yes stop_codon:yes gene_type:complete
MKQKFFFKPVFWPTVFFVFSFIILLSLGTWQVKRLIWKNDLISFYLKQSTNNIINLHKENFVSEEIEYRKVRLTGKFLNKKEVHITGKTYEGNAGFHVVTPFLMQNGNYVLVNRGWVSENYKEAKSRSFSLINEETSVIGLIRYPQKKGYFVPENEPDNGFWFTIKPTEIKKHLKIDKETFIIKFYVDALRQEKKINLPIGIKEKINIRNQHLSYAITWYSLAIVLMIIYLSYHYSEGKLRIRKL